MEKAFVKLQCPHPTCSKFVNEKDFDLHVRLCRQRNNSPIIECVYNLSHAVPKAEIVSHMKTCESRRVVANLQKLSKKKAFNDNQAMPTKTKQTKEIKTIDDLFKFDENN